MLRKICCKKLIEMKKFTYNETLEQQPANYENEYNDIYGAVIRDFQSTNPFFNIYLFLTLSSGTQSFYFIYVSKYFIIFDIHLLYFDNKFTTSKSYDIRSITPFFKIIIKWIIHSNRKINLNNSTKQYSIYFIILINSLQFLIIFKVYQIFKKSLCLSNEKTKEKIILYLIGILLNKILKAKIHFLNEKIRPKYNLNLKDNSKNDYYKINAINNKKKIIIKKSIHLRNLFVLIKNILLINLFIQILSNNKTISFAQFRFSNISLKIKGTGTKNIFSSDFRFSIDNYPKEVYINKYKQSNVSHSYYFNQSYNYVELIWYNTINNCECIFKECIDIIEIDLTNFDSSQVTNMELMFYGCSSLTSINLSNLNTSKVKNMWSMFYNCSSLTSIDLSNFNTSKVENMQYMFGYCSSLSLLN